MQQTPRAILALGVIAHDAVLMALGLKKAAHRFAHGAEHAVSLAGRSIHLFDSYHVSRYNTQTGRLTEAMFDTVVQRVSERLHAPSPSPAGYADVRRHPAATERSLT